MHNRLIAMNNFFRNSIVGVYPLEVQCEMQADLGLDGVYLSLSQEELAQRDPAETAATVHRHGLDLAVVYTLPDLSDPAALPPILRFFDAYLRCGEPGFRSVTTGKGFWAASMLYRLTGRERYLEVVRKAGAYLISLQREDGLWMWPGKTEEEMGAKLKFDASPEYVRWFLEVAAELSVAAK